MLGRAVAVGHVLGAAAGLRETDRLRDVIGERHRWHAVRGHLHELGGDLPAAATAYAEAARRATNVAERDHLVRQAARARAGVGAPRSPCSVLSGSRWDLVSCWTASPWSWRGRASSRSLRITSCGSRLSSTGSAGIRGPPKA